MAVDVLVTVLGELAAFTAVDVAKVAVAGVGSVVYVANGCTNASYRQTTPLPSY